MYHISSESREAVDYESVSKIFESSRSFLLQGWIKECFYFAAPGFAITPKLSHVAQSNLTYTYHTQTPYFADGFVKIGP